MRVRRILQEMLIAIGVAAGVMAVGCLGLLASGPLLRSSGLVSNLCTVDRDLVFQKTATGLGANTQVMQLAVRMQAQIDSERRAMNLLPPEHTSNPQLPLADHSKLNPQRMADLERRVATTNAQLQAVRASATVIVNRHLAPIVVREGQRAGCSAIVSRAALVDVGSSIDLTPRI